MFNFSRGSKRTVGLDIGSSSVKVVEFDHSGEQPRLVKFGRCGLLPEAIVDGEIMDRDVVVDTIAELMEVNDITSRDVVAAVSGRAVIVKKVVMDKMNPDDAKEAIFWEAEQHVPFDIDDVCLDFQVLKPRQLGWWQALPGRQSTMNAVGPWNRAPRLCARGLQG